MGSNDGGDDVTDNHTLARGLSSADPEEARRRTTRRTGNSGLFNRLVVVWRGGSFARLGRQRGSAAERVVGTERLGAGRDRAWHRRCFSVHRPQIPVSGPVPGTDELYTQTLARRQCATTGPRRWGASRHLLCRLLLGADALDVHRWHGKRRLDVAAGRDNGD